MIQQVSKTCISCQALRVEPKRTKFGKLITLEQFSVKKFANVCLLFMTFWMWHNITYIRCWKSVLLKKCIKDENIRQLASIFLQPDTHTFCLCFGVVFRWRSPSFNWTWSVWFLSLSLASSLKFVIAYKIYAMLRYVHTLCFLILGQYSSVVYRHQRE